MSLAVAPVAFAQQPPSSLPAFESQWAQYAARFLKPDGRIWDNYSDVSHTEGQGTGLIFAAYAGDREAYERIWTWTRANLRRPDGLFRWRHDPAVPLRAQDPNNATDGDLLLAWGLLLGAERFGAPEHRREALRIVAAIERHALREHRGRLYLLPAAFGFESSAGVVVNPSYYVWPALSALQEASGSAPLRRVIGDGLDFLESARFGAAGLPPDWSLLAPDGAVDLWPEREPRFGYEAIRVPVYLIWDGRGEAEALAPYCAAWAAIPPEDPPPSWIDLVTGAEAPYRASNGFLAVKSLTRARCAGAIAALPALTPADDYYAASLVLFAQLAARRDAPSP